jgi:predicted MPP superfamily phosphohydrolase
MLDSGLDTAFRWLADAGVGLIVVSFGYGYSIGQSRLRITRLDLPMQHATAGLHGLRIVQISDIHIGQNLEREQLDRFVAQTNALQPDVVCITGDIIDGPWADIDRFLPILTQLRATHGVFAILGNHDHYAGADRVEAILRQQTPFTVLRDQQTTIQVNGHPLHIIGLDDRGRDWARGVPSVPYLSSALAAIPADEPVLLLCHRPDIFTHAAAEGVDLTLSGHTHGGQLAMPWFNGRARNLAEFITPYDRGLFQRNGSYLYVNCGLGVTGQRLRLCTPREITLITVEHASCGTLAA